MSFNIIKLNAIASTNDYVKDQLGTLSQKTPVVVWALHQTQGRGQRGSTWTVDAGKSLTFSVLVKPHRVLMQDQFSMSMATSLAITNVLKRYQIPKLAIKWPNDILADRYKIGGVLIECMSKGSYVETAIVGFGLNVNQLNFDSLPQASSMAKLTGKQFDLEELLYQLTEAIVFNIQRLSQWDREQITNAYLAELFRYNKPSTFNTKDEKKIPGIIKGISRHGELLVKFDRDEEPNAFGLKAIEMLY